MKIELKFITINSILSFKIAICKLSFKFNICATKIRFCDKVFFLIYDIIFVIVKLKFVGNDIGKDSVANNKI